MISLWYFSFSFFTFLLFSFLHLLITLLPNFVLLLRNGIFWVVFLMEVTLLVFPGTLPWASPNRNCLSDNTSYLFVIAMSCRVECVEHFVNLLEYLPLTSFQSCLENSLIFCRSLSVQLHGAHNLFTSSCSTLMINCVSVTYYSNSSKCLPPSLKLLPSLRGTSCSAKHGTHNSDLQCVTEEVAS